MWKIARHNNYARLTCRLRVVTALLIRTRPEEGFHFSEFIRFLGNRISGARYRPPGSAGILACVESKQAGKDACAPRFATAGGTDPGSARKTSNSTRNRASAFVW